MWINSMFFKSSQAYLFLRFFLYQRSSKLKKMFLNDGYLSSFFNKILTSFQSSNKFSQNISFENCFCIPYLGKESHHFANSLFALIKNKYNLKKYLPSIKILK